MKHIEIKSAKQNNLKSIDLHIPLKTYTVICGPSGSGKSSLAFETLFAEGQRHYTQTLSHYHRQYIQELKKPLVKSIKNIPPALALQQKNPTRSDRPTVATLTEIDHLLCHLFTSSAVAFCPKHKKQALLPFSPSAGAQKIKASFKKGVISVPIMPAQSGLSALDLYKKLLKAGLDRAWTKKNQKGLPLIQDLKSFFNNKKGREKFTVKKFYLVLDRLLFTDINRIQDSLKSAYLCFLKYNKTEMAGQALVSGPDRKDLFLSEQPACSICASRFPFFPLPVGLFNFNSSIGACKTCRGFGSQLVLDEDKIIPNPKKSLIEGAIAPFALPSGTAEFRSLIQFCRSQKIDLHLAYRNLPTTHKEKIWQGCPSFIGVKGFFDQLENQKYKMHVRVFLTRWKSAVPCPDCQGGRFRKEVHLIRYRGKTLIELFAMNIKELSAFFNSFKGSLKEQGMQKKIKALLNTLNQMGLGYLHLNRGVKTLSSGEFQRLNLVHHIGLELSQVLYVLDEPTVGLHAKDSERLIELLNQLKTQGNTLVVVEHDIEMIKSADFVVELGPGAGFKGGHVVWQGDKKHFLSQSQMGIEMSKKKLKNLIVPIDFHHHKYFLEISGCSAHNLKNVCLQVPLKRLVTVTGVSGSGKSTLVRHTLYPALAQTLEQKPIKGHPFFTLKGARYIQQVRLLDSTPLNKSSTSFPVTYIGIYDSIRKLMSEHAKKTGGHLTALEPIPSRFFSLNVEGGRCPTCKGLGYQEIEMVFMDAIRTVCEECQGQRFTKEVLSLKWRDKNIQQILDMTVDTASEFFVSYPEIWRPLSFLKKVGLGYLVLGQSLATLSGGEIQRLKLSRELMGRPKNTLYVLDEPTVGLHFREVQLLISLLKELVRQGASALVVEHNIDMIQQSDYMVDMGPGAGPDGGQIVAQGSPFDVAKNPASPTGPFLQKLM